MPYGGSALLAANDSAAQTVNYKYSCHRRMTMTLQLYR